MQVAVGGAAAYLTDSSCAFDTNGHYHDPVALVNEFLSRDEDGAFLKSDPWFDGATTCPGHEPGPDTFVIIDGRHVTFDTLPGDTVRARVTYRRLGLLGGGTHFDVDTGESVRELKVVNTPFGWRILSPALNQHVDVDALSALKWLPDSLRRRIEALVPRRGA